MKLNNLEMTCGACPSQWEAKLDDGRMVYIRYRWAHLEVTVSKNPTDDVGDAVRGESVFSKDIGEMYDGCMDTEEMLAETGYTI